MEQALAKIGTVSPLANFNFPSSVFFYGCYLAVTSYNF
jgi:hypothetical protein